MLNNKLLCIKVIEYYLNRFVEQNELTSDTANTFQKCKNTKNYIHCRLHTNVQY